MIEEIVNEDIEKQQKVLKAQKKQQKQFSNMEKIIKSNKCSILWLAYQQGQIFEKLKVNENFINMVKELGTSKSTILFKILIIKFVNKYPRMKKSLFCLHFLKNNF